MPKHRIVTIALLLNLIVSGFYISQSIFDYQYYKNISFFSDLEQVFFSLVTVCPAVFASIAFFKIRWATYLSTVSGICLFGILIYTFLSLYFDPLEKGRNGEFISLIGLCSILLICLLYNLWALILLLRYNYNTHQKTAS